MHRPQAGSCRVEARQTKRPAEAGLRGLRNGGQGRNRTGVHGFAGRCMTTLPPGHRARNAHRGPLKKQNPGGPRFRETGAGNETRTRDPDLGKVVLYQLSYSRVRVGKDSRTAPDVKASAALSACFRSDRRNDEAPAWPGLRENLERETRLELA